MSAQQEKSSSKTRITLDRGELLVRDDKVIVWPHDSGAPQFIEVDLVSGRIRSTSTTVEEVRVVEDWGLVEEADPPVCDSDAPDEVIFHDG